MTRNIWVFFLCAILVFITQFNLLEPILQYRLFNTTQDWPDLIWYHGLDLNFWNKLVYVWKTFGLHESAQVLHIGILSDFLGSNYSAYQVVNVTLKAIGTISFFPLVLILFKSRKLAFLATSFFGISSATAGSFLWVVKGSEYIGIALLNIFLVTYYFVILKNSKRLLILSSILFLAAYLMAPPRMYPQLLLIPLVEIYWLLKTRKLKNLTVSVIRSIVYILPVILISLPAPISPGFPFAKRPFMLIKDILDGKWDNLLDPFAGIGWTLVTNDFWQFFGTLELDSFANLNNYAKFLVRPVLIFGLLTLILAPILSKKPKQFFALVFGVNLLLEILIFVIARYEFAYLEILEMKHDISHFLYTKYPSMIGLYIYAVVFVCFLEWKKQRGNELLRAIWVGPIFSVIFLWPTWAVMGPLVNDYSSVHWYFGIPAMGTTLFLAAILVLFYEKLKQIKLTKLFAVLTILAIAIIFYIFHGMAISKQYLGINTEKVSLADQQKLQGELINKLGDSVKTGDILVFLDIAEDTVNLRRTKQYYREALVVHHFGYWVHFRREGNGTVNNGCIEAVTDKETLKSKFVLKDGKKGFIYTGYCISKSAGVNTQDKIFYGLDNFYAFRIQGGEFIDIKEKILKDLF